MKKYEGYKGGDICEWAGARGTIVYIADSDERPYGDEIDVGFGKNFASFNIDGTYCKWHKEPSLIVIDRPKKKVKKTFWFASWDCVGVRKCNLMCTEKREVEIALSYACFPPQVKDTQIHSIEIEVDDE